MTTIDRLRVNPVNASVFGVASSYLAVAKHLMATRTKEINTAACGSAFLLAALSCEIFLKSLLIKSIVTFEDNPDEDGLYEFSASNEKVKFDGHLFDKLYKKIKTNKLDAILLEALGMSEDELFTEFSRYQCYFTKTRYRYEIDSLKNTDSGVIDLAKTLEAALMRISETHEANSYR